MNTRLTRVLVLDDDQLQLKIMRAMLDRVVGAHSTCTDDPQDAIASIKAGEVDLVFLDLNMPRMNGLEFMKALGSIAYRGALVLVSAHNDRVLESSKDLAVSYGLNVLEILRKPVVLESISAIVQKFDSSAGPVKKAGNVSGKASITVEEMQLDIAGVTDNLTLVYQPKYAMATGRIAGYEVLSRWQQDGVLLSPQHFIPLAHETGLIDELSMRIYRKALEANRDLRRNGFTVEMSVNFSIGTLSLQGIVERLVDMAQEYETDPSLITLEITEDQIYGSIQEYLEKLMYLIFRGIKLSIDDFGTGQSSLSQLKSIPFSELKVDRSFVYQASQDYRSAALFESSVRLARQFGMSVVAEGGETSEDWEFARKLGCDYFQGYYKSKPVVFDAILALLQRERADAAG